MEGKGIAKVTWRVVLGRIACDVVSSATMNAECVL